MTDKKLKKMLIAKRRNVRTKLEQLKHGEILQESMFNPITKHLKNIESTLQQSPQYDKNTNSYKYEAQQKKQKEQLQGEKDMEEEEKEEEKPETKTELIKNITPKIPMTRRLSFNNKSTPQKRKLSTSTNYNTPSELKQSIIDEVNSSYDDDEDVYDNYDDEGKQASSTNRLQDIAESSFLDYLEQYEPLPRKYISAMYEDVDNKEFDHKYGVRLDKITEKFKIGDSQLDIIGSDVYVKGKRYKGTLGLYELLFKKYPLDSLVSADDLQNYKQIVYKTNAHKRYYKPNAQVDGSKLQKYKKIIAPTGGKGLMTMMEITGNKKDYVYWDNPNELVDRLRLLLSSQAAGHTGHVNEINSLIEELKEAGIIA